MNRRFQREATIAIFLGVGTALLLTRGEGTYPARIRLAVVTGLAIGFACIGVAYARNYRAFREKFRAQSPGERRNASILNLVGCGVLLFMIVIFFLLVVVQTITG